MDELSVLSQLNNEAKQPAVYCLGGAKLEECFNLAEHALSNKKAKNVLASGLFGEVLLVASGKELGAKRAWLEEHGYLEFLTRARCLWAKYADELILPIDFAFVGVDGFRVETSDPLKASSPVFDVGVETIALFTRYLKKARTIFVKGPAGKYEEPCFELGTKELFKAVSRSKAFSVVGGGDTGAAINSLGLKERDFGHVCTAGGAMLDYLIGKELPGVSALTSS
jgi:phosphoglycerate kinase